MNVIHCYITLIKHQYVPSMNTWCYHQNDSTSLYIHNVQSTPWNPISQRNILMGFRKSFKTVSYNDYIVWNLIFLACPACLPSTTPHVVFYKPNDQLLSVLTSVFVLLGFMQGNHKHSLMWFKLYRWMLLNNSWLAYHYAHDSHFVVAFYPYQWLLQCLAKPRMICVN